MTTIRQLAQREKRAEVDRKTAEEAWRTAWWATTYALGEYTDKTALAEACTVVSKATGRSPGYIRSRAKTGAAFLAAGHRNDTLPPRMAIELVSHKVGLTDEVIEGLVAAERDGKSLREYSASLTGRGWSDTAAGASADKIEQIFAAQPEAVAEMVAKSPELYEAARDIHFREEMESRRRNPGRWDQGAEQLLSREQLPGSVQHTTLTTLVLAVKRIRSLTEDRPLSDKAKANLRWAVAELTAIVEGEEFVGDLESWLEGVS